MNVIFLTLSNIRDINAGGIYTDLMRKFRDEGHEVYIICPFERRHKQSTTLMVQDRVKILGVRTLNIQKTNYFEKAIGTALLEHQYRKAIKKYLKGEQFDLILYSTPPLNITNILKFLRKRNPRVVTYLMLKDISPQDFVDLEILSYKSALYKYFRKIEERLYHLSDYIGCMSPANVHYILKHNPSLDPKRVELAVNSVDVQRIFRHNKNKKELREKYRIPTNALVLIYGGNFGIAQAVNFIISCLDYYKEEKDVYFILVGGGTHFHLLKKWKEGNMLCSNVFIQSMMPKEEYESMLSVADIGLIFLDYRFSFPNYPSRLLSYLSHGIPILAATDDVSDVGTIAEENNYGLKCSSNDIASFVNCVEAYRKKSLEELKTMGQNGYSYLMNNYLTEHTYNSIISHFEDAKK